MNTFDGYIRRDGTNSKVLLDGGDAKALSSFIGTLSYNNNKITYTKADGSTSYDLVTLEPNIISDFFVGNLNDNSTTTTVLTNGNVYLHFKEGNSESKFKISGSQNIAVTTDASGNIIITGPDLSGLAVSENLNNYLPLTGGVLLSNSQNTPLHIKSYNGVNSYIGFLSNTGSYLGYYGFENSVPKVYIGETNGYTVLHSGNSNISNGVITINGSTITPITSLSGYATEQFVTDKLSSVLDIKIVSSLPTTDINTKTLYLMSAGSTGTNDLYEEYAYINKGTSSNPNWNWERLGTVHLNYSDFVTALSFSDNKLQWTKGSTAQTGIEIGYASYASSLQRTSIADSSGLLMYSGQFTYNDKAKAGSYGDYSIWSYPDGGSYINYSNNNPISVNLMGVRLYWESTFFHDLLFSPNNSFIYYRNVFNSSPSNWFIIPKYLYIKDNTSLGSSTNPVYINSSGEFTTCDSYPTKASWNYDDVYLKLSGGTMTGNISFSDDNNITWSRNTDYAKIHFKNTGDGDTDSYLGFETADNGNEYFRFGHTSGTYTEWMSIKSDGVRVKGTLVSLEGHNHDDLYVPLAGNSTITGTITISPTNTSSWLKGLVLHDPGGGGLEASWIEWTSASYPNGVRLVGAPDSKALYFWDTNAWQTVYHTGNLPAYPTDADTLDGYHASDFIKTEASEQTIVSTISSMSMGAVNIYRMVNGGWSAIGYSGYNNGQELWGYLGFIGKNNPTYIDSSLNTYTLIHSGNIGSQSVSYASSAGVASLLRGADNRSTNDAPSVYMSKGIASIYAEFSQSGGASSDYSGYGCRVTFTPWGDASGGRPVLLEFNNQNVYIRGAASDSEWNSWKTIIDSGNIGSQSVNYATSAESSSILSSYRSDCTGTGSSQVYHWNDWDNTSSLGSYFHGIWAGSVDGNIGFQIAQLHGYYDQLYIRTFDYGTWNNWRTLITSGNIGSQSVSYATSATRLYASDSPYRYGDNNPYYAYFTYNDYGDNRWYMRVSSATPADIRVDYAGNADTVDGCHSSSFLNYEGWWSGSENVNDAAGMVFCYTSQGAPGPSWGTLSTFEYSRGSDYKMLLFSDGYYDGYTYYRNKSNDRGGWGSWIHLLDSTNYTWYALKNYGADTARPDGRSFTLPGGANPVSMHSGSSSGADLGIFYLSDDNAFICNSSDNGYAFAVFDTDRTADFSSSANAAFAVLSDHQGVVVTGSVGIGTTSPYYKLHIDGDSYTTGWSRAGNGFYCEGNGIHYTHAGTRGEIYTSSDNVFNFTTGSWTTLYFNYGSDKVGNTWVSDYVWNAGSSSSWASHTMGHLSVCANTESVYPNYASIEVRERNRGLTEITHNYANAPRIGFHWGGRYYANLTYFDGVFRFMNELCNGYVTTLSSGFKHSSVDSDNYVLLAGGGYEDINSLPYDYKHGEWIDLTGYSESYWHPVVTYIPSEGYKKIKVTVQLNSGTRPSWSTHSSGFTCNFEAYVTASGWGTTNSETIILNNSYGFANDNPVGFGQLSDPSQAVLYLRGGGKYYVITDWNTSWNIYNQSYTWTSGQYSQTAGPYTSNPGCFVGLVKNYIYAHTQGNVITDDWLSIRDYTGSYHGRSNNISGYAGEIWFGGNFHIDSQNGLYLYLNYYSQYNTFINPRGGNVGIGTDSPQVKLHVSGALAVIDDSCNTGYNALAYLRHYSNNDWGLIVDKSSSYSYGVDIRAGGEYALRITGGGGFVSDGNVTATAFYASSDLRLKNIITRPNYSAEQLASLPLVKYTWKDKENDSIHLGSIAQNAEEDFAELVNTDDKGYKSLDYATLGTIGVISLAREIVELRKEIKELKSKLYG